MSLASESMFEAPARTGRTVKWPATATCAALGSGLLLLLLVTGDRLLNDPDTQWHIAVGRWIVAHGEVPRSDIFSYTFAGSPWIAKEWVSQLLLHFAYEGGGWNGVVLLTAVALSATFIGLFAWLQGRVQTKVALAMTFAAFFMCEPFMLARPHVLVFPVIVAWMISLVDALDHRRAPRAWTALLMVAWVNMHGSFPLGLVMAGLLAGEGIVFAPRSDRAATLLRWALFLLLAAAATMLSPFGWRAILVPLMMFGNGGTLHFVDEWQPLGLDQTGVIAGLILAATMAALLLDARANVFRILAATLVAYLMIRHVRFVSLFGLVSPILCARSVASRWPVSRPAVLSKAQATTLGIAIGILVVADAVLAMALRPQPDARVTPTRAYEAAMARGAHGPVYNDYDFGGFLIAHDVKTFVDGRTDQLFLGDFLPDLAKAIGEKDGKAFSAIVAKSKADWALIRPASRTSAHFDAMPGWVRVYVDENAAAYVRD